MSKCYGATISDGMTPRPECQGPRQAVRPASEYCIKNVDTGKYTHLLPFNHGQQKNIVSQVREQPETVDYTHHFALRFLDEALDRRRCCQRWYQKRGRIGTSGIAN